MSEQAQSYGAAVVTDDDVAAIDHHIDELKARHSKNARRRFIPQGQNHTQELANIRALLHLGRIEEAKTRLDVALDRHDRYWREYTV